MTRSQQAIELLRRATPYVDPSLRALIESVLAMPEGEGEKADREVAELLALAKR